MPKGVYTRKRAAPPLLNADGSVSIPLCARDGTVRAYAIVDAADAEWATQWQWSLAGEYVARSEYFKDGWPRIRQFRLHRELLGLVHGDGREGDHIDLDKLNNRRSNLRETTRPENAQNRPSYAGSTSSYRGVFWHRDHQRWVAVVKIAGKRVWSSEFADEHEAGEAARSARERLMTHATS